jgi:hypothetical protein
MEQDTGDYFAAKRGKSSELPAPAEDAGAGVGMRGYVNRLFQIESGGDPQAVTGSNRGLGQFGPAEERMYGITDANRERPEAQAAAVMAERAANDPSLRRALGREPTHADHYLAHQQGLAGASALLGNPNIPAWQAIRPFYRSDAIAQKAITGNIPGDNPLKRLGVNDISSAGFTAMWRDKFNHGLKGDAGGAVAFDTRAEQAAATVRRFPYTAQMAMAGNFMHIGELSSQAQPSKNIEDRRLSHMTEEEADDWRQEMMRRQGKPAEIVDELEARRARKAKAEGK